MNNHSKRVVKHLVLFALPLVFFVFFSHSMALAGGSDLPYQEGMFPNISKESNSENSELSNTPIQNVSPTPEKPIVTVLPTQFDWKGWKETKKMDDQICRSDGLNTLCFSPEQAKALGW